MSPTDKPTRKKLSPSDFTKYSSLVFQMIVLVGGAAWLGTWLDRKMENSQPVMAIVLILLGIGVSLYTTIRTLLSKDK
jgi:F0F1-type ATP synthase assembly protein I